MFQNYYCGEARLHGRDGTTCWRRRPLFILSSRALGPCKLEKSGPVAEREAKNNHLCALPGINIPAPFGKENIIVPRVFLYFFIARRPGTSPFQRAASAESHKSWKGGHQDPLFPERTVSTFLLSRRERRVSPGAAFLCDSSGETTKWVLKRKLMKRILKINWITAWLVWSYKNIEGYSHRQ